LYTSEIVVEGQLKHLIRVKLLTVGAAFSIGYESGNLIPGD
ncbi:9272_t:CDS:2, partial [Gigaspora rosea]